MAVDFFFHDQVSTKECAGRGDETRGRLHAKRTRFRSFQRAQLPKNLGELLDYDDDDDDDDDIGLHLKHIGVIITS